MSRSLIRLKRRVQELESPGRTFSATLAEDYDGIGQYVLVSLAGSSVGSGYKAQLPAGAFGSGMRVPKGTRVMIFANHGKVEVTSMSPRVHPGVAAEIYDDDQEG